MTEPERKRLLSDPEFEARWKSGMRQLLLDDPGFAAEKIDETVDHLWVQAKKMAMELRATTTPSECNTCSCPGNRCWRGLR